MSEPQYAITVVVDREFGDRLFAIPANMPVWIVDTPINRAAAQKAWAQRRSESHLHGVTTFNFSESQSAEETFLAELETIDLHHGSYSARPPYTVVDVVGAEVSDRIKSEMAAFGFNEFHHAPFGFRAIRPLPSDNPE